MTPCLGRCQGNYPGLMPPIFMPNRSCTWGSPPSSSGKSEDNLAPAGISLQGAMATCTFYQRGPCLYQVPFFPLWPIGFIFPSEGHPDQAEAGNAYRPPGQLPPGYVCRFPFLGAIAARDYALCLTEKRARRSMCKG